MSETIRITYYDQHGNGPLVEEVEIRKMPIFRRWWIVIRKKVLRIRATRIEKIEVLTVGSAPVSGTISLYDKK